MNNSKNNKQQQKTTYRRNSGKREIPTSTETNGEKVKHPQTKRIREENSKLTAEKWPRDEAGRNFQTPKQYIPTTKHSSTTEEKRDGKETPPKAKELTTIQHAIKIVSTPPIEQENTTPRPEQEENGSRKTARRPENKSIENKCNPRRSPETNTEKGHKITENTNTYAPNHANTRKMHR